MLECGIPSDKIIAMLQKYWDLRLSEASTIDKGHIKKMETKIRKLILPIFIVYRNEIGNVLDVVVYILFIGRINRKIVQYFLQIWYLGIINYIRHFTHPRLPLYGFQFLRRKLL